MRKHYMCVFINVQGQFSVLQQWGAMEQSFWIKKLQCSKPLWHSMKCWLVKIFQELPMKWSLRIVFLDKVTNSHGQSKEIRGVGDGKYGQKQGRYAYHMDYLPLIMAATWPYCKEGFLVIGGSTILLNHLKHDFWRSTMRMTDTDTMKGQFPSSE